MFRVQVSLFVIYRFEVSLIIVELSGKNNTLLKHKNERKHIISTYFSNLFILERLQLPCYEYRSKFASTSCNRRMASMFDPFDINFILRGGPYLYRALAFKQLAEYSEVIGKTRSKNSRKINLLQFNI